MGWIAAGRFFADGANRVSASIRAGRHFAIRSPAEIGPQIILSWRVGGLLFIFQSPLLLGRVIEAEIVDTRINVLLLLDLSL